MLGDTEQPIIRLSSGNQQKVLFARAALQHPKPLLLDEPTKGVDIGAKAEIHALIRAMVADGDVAVVVVSTEEEELIGLADAVCVVQERIVRRHQIPARFGHAGRLAPSRLAQQRSSG